MIWFDIKELERELQSGDLSDKYVFNYFVVNLIGCSIAPYISSNDFTTKWLIVIQIVIGVIITVLLVSKTFDINTAGDGKDYFKRFIALSFVTGFRLLVLACIAGIPIAVVVYLAEQTIGVNENIRDLLYLAMTTVAGIVYYYMLTNSFRRVSQ